MKYRVSLLLSAVMLIFGSIATLAQKRPDVSGTWKMNAAKSQFADNGPKSITIRFSQKDSTLFETLTLMAGDEEKSFDVKYATDGKEGVAQIGEKSATTTVTWDGDALVIEWKGDGQSLRRKITLSGDGKTMTMMVRHAEPNGETANDTVVLEKQ